MSTFNLECLIKKPACFQSGHPTCINLILTNKKRFFKTANVLEAGISDHHCFIVTTLINQLIKYDAKVKFWRDCNFCITENFKAELYQNLKNNTSFEYSYFKNTFIRVIHKHAPLMKKILQKGSTIAVSWPEQ